MTEITFEPAERNIELEPSDYDWMPQKGARKRKVAIAAQSFDRADIIRQLTISRTPVSAGDIAGWRWVDTMLANPDRLIPDLKRPYVGMGLEEARFWFSAGSSCYDRLWKGDLDELGRESYLEDLDVESALDAFSYVGYTHYSSYVVVAAFMLISFESLIDVLIRSIALPQHPRTPPYVILIHGFSQHLVSYISDQQLNYMRDRFSAVYERYIGRKDRELPYVLVELARSLNMIPELQAIVESWPRAAAMTIKSSWNSTGQHAVFCLQDPIVIEREMRRQQFPLNSPEDIGKWLAVTGYKALDFVRDSMVLAGSKDRADMLIRTFGRVHAPEAATYFLDLYLDSRAPLAAKEWFDLNPLHAIAGLVPIVASDGDRSGIAAEILREFTDTNHNLAIRHAMSKLTSLEAARVIELVLDYKSPMSKCEPLVAGEEPEVDAIMLEFSRAAKLDIPLLDLPPVMTKRQPNKRLSDVQTIALMKAIKGSKLSNPHGFCFAVKSAATPESLEKFARYLFDYWRRNGAESKNRWQFMALGLFGGDATVNQLMKLIRRWPGEGQHPSAVYGLECVGSIGSDYALIEISRLAQNSKFRGLKGAANTCIENIAGRRGLTRDELEDRIVPHCGLGASEPQIFDFGCRQFKLALGPGLKPMIVQPDGKYRTDLPKPGAADDPTIAREAVAEWKAAKKQITDTVKMQSIRLEQAMILGRRWSYDEFQRFFVHHPLMTNVIYHIVWASFGDEDSKIDTFRVTEDGSLADPRDKPYNPPFHAQIGIPHPIQLSNLDLKAWGEQLSDYEITPLFPQIGRPTYRLEPSEKEAQEVTRFTNQKISASWLIFTLDKLGWTRGLSEDGGWIIAHSKHFQSANVTAFVQYTPGVIVGMIPNSEEQTVSYIFFTPSTSNGSNVQTHFSDRVVLGEIDPVAVSEVLADLSVVFAKAK